MPETYLKAKNIDRGGITTKDMNKVMKPRMTGRTTAEISVESHGKYIYI